MIGITVTIPADDIVTMMVVCEVCVVVLVASADTNVGDALFAFVETLAGAVEDALSVDLVIKVSPRSNELAA